MCEGKDRCRHANKAAPAAQQVLHNPRMLQRRVAVECVRATRFTARFRTRPRFDRPTDLPVAWDRLLRLGGPSPCARDTAASGVRIHARASARPCGRPNVSKRTFQPNNRRRAKTHGFRLRMRTRAGRAVLAARRRKQRRVLSA